MENRGPHQERAKREYPSFEASMKGILAPTADAATKKDLDDAVNNDPFLRSSGR
jgi:hypothetical protein